MIGLFVRPLNESLSSMDIVFLRAVLTALILFVGLVIRSRNLLRIKIKDIWCFLGTGLVSVVFFNFCYFTTVSVTSLSVAAVLLYTAPAFVMIISAVLFGEKITGMKVLALISTVLGCILVTGILSDTPMLNAKGILIGLGAGIGYALYSIFSRFAIIRGYESITISFYTFLIATFGTIPFCNINRVRDCVFSGEGEFVLVMGLALISTVLPYILYTRGLKGLENTQASIIASIEPVTATILGVLCYKESLSIIAIAGICLVIQGIVLSSGDNTNS